MKIEVFALEIVFKLRKWVQITPLAVFTHKKIQNQNGSTPKNARNTSRLLKMSHSDRHEAVIAS